VFGVKASFEMASTQSEMWQTPDNAVFGISFIDALDTVLDTSVTSKVRPTVVGIVGTESEVSRRTSVAMQTRHTLLAVALPAVIALDTAVHRASNVAVTI